LFNQPKSEYPDLEEVGTSFRPFFELLDIASQFEVNYKDWT
jgi:hypothetical protein